DWLCKVTPVLQHIRKKFLEIDTENQFSIDDRMVFVSAFVSGIVYNFLKYAGNSTFGTAQDPVKELELGVNVVFQLCKTIRNPLEVLWLAKNRLKDAKSLGVQKQKKLKMFRLELQMLLCMVERKAGPPSVGEGKVQVLPRWTENHLLL
ncbi:hypothetical protein Z043_121638, partial [Scleropages formosus]